MNKMWGTIEGKKIKEIKESFCLGEACLIFEYDKDTERTVAFKTAADLRKIQTFFMLGAKLERRKGLARAGLP